MKETANRYTIALLSVVVVLALAALIALASAWPGALPLDRTIAGDPGNSSNIMENVTVANGTFTVEWYKDDGSPNGYYTIDGGSNVDERPRGLYDFLTGAGEDKWAYRYQFCGGGGPSIEFTATQYVNISADDDLEVCDVTTTDGCYAAHRFNFSINDSCTCTCINESALEMSVINVTWNGKGWHDTLTDGAKLYIYNFTSAAYEQLDTDTQTPAVEVTLTGEKTSSVSSYISPSGNVTILVKQTSAQTSGPGGVEYSHICTDYVKLVVTPDP